MNGTDWILTILFLLFIIGVLAQIPIGVWIVLILILIIRGIFK